MNEQSQKKYRTEATPSYYGEEVICHVSDAPIEHKIGDMVTFHYDVQYTKETSCSFCYKKDIACIELNIPCTHQKIRDFDDLCYFAEEIVYICIECLQKWIEAIKRHKVLEERVAEVRQNLEQKIDSRISIIKHANKQTKKIEGILTKVTKGKIYILKDGNQKATGVNLIEVDLENIKLED